MPRSKSYGITLYWKAIVGGEEHMSKEENKRLAREAIEIWTTGDVDAADAAGYLGCQKRSCRSWRPSLGMKRLPS